MRLQEIKKQTKMIKELQENLNKSLGLNNLEGKLDIIHIKEEINNSS